jgi:basic membrane lipoprotein Med (substrate-binding protein (PBP1-ABC) superfamily)
VTYKGLKEGGVDWVAGQGQPRHRPPEMEKRVNAAKADIISGKIKVVDYRAAGSCPVKGPRKTVSFAETKRAAPVRDRRGALFE